jgi:hypothetical protein
MFISWIDLMHDRPAHDRLDTRKEIAAYLRKEVRTVQRWEKKLGLPVRRLTQGKQGTVFAYRSGLDAWWSKVRASLRKRNPINRMWAHDKVRQPHTRTSISFLVACTHRTQTVALPHLKDPGGSDGTSAL